MPKQAQEIRLDIEQVKLPRYIEIKIDMLENDFFVVLSDDQKQHMHSLKTENAVDRYCRSLLLHKYA